MASPLIALLQTPDRAALEALLAGSVRFHSPVADYEGRQDVAHLLSVIATVVHDVQPTRELEDEAARTTFMSGVVEGNPVQGVLDEHYDEHARLVEVTLMLRPLATLRIAVAAMAAAMDAETPAQHALTPGLPEDYEEPAGDYMSCRSPRDG